MISPPSAVRTSTHDVCPPKRTVASPGVGMDPRHPHTLTRNDTSSVARDRLPEERDHSDELGRGGEERHSRDGEAPALSVEARHPELPVGRSSLEKRNPRRVALERHRAAVELLDA